MVTQYPTAIDGYSNIRMVRDRIEEIVANDNNSLRSAIIAIEQTLGINPQGIFGTVVARLDQLGTDIIGHFNGTDHRHNTNHIDYPGSFPYGFADGYVLPPAKLGDTLDEFVRLFGSKVDSDGANKIGYKGSSYGFADGYVMIPAPLGSTVSEIVKRLGSKSSSDGANSIGYQGSSYGFADGYVLPSSRLGAAVSQIVKQVGSSTGGTKIGETAFTTSKYSFSGTNVDSQIRTIAGYMNENATFMERAFDSFVIEGMIVSQLSGGPNGLIAPGYLASNGRLAKFNGASFIISSPGTYYVCAKILNSAIVVTVTTSLNSVVDPVSPVVLLGQFTTAGGAWTSFTDLRRYGSFVNDKNYLTVGNAPSSSGKDGYGCDFTKLSSAIGYIKALNSLSPQKMIVPKKIILVSDLSISTTIEASVLLDIAGIEIDGAGRKISVSIDAPVFKIQASYIHIHDLTVEFNLSSSPSTASLAYIATIYPPAVTLEGIQITNCTVTRVGTYAAAYFIRCGRAAVSDDNAIKNSIFSYNVAEVLKAGISFSNTVTIPNYVLYSSIITGNRFFQTTYSSSTEPCIRANNNCIVTNNTIMGGFNYGVSMYNNSSAVIAGLSVISGNAINGGIGAALMAVGISVGNTSVVAADSIISNNVISGVFSYGINASINTSGLIISNNIIDNSILSVLAPYMVGINGSGNDDLVVNNRIVIPGSYGISNAKHVVDNFIYGSTSVSGIAVSMPASIQNAVVSGNFIYNVSGIGIDGNSCSKLLINNNMLVGNSYSGSGIINVNEYSSISNNTIMNYGYLSSSIGISTGGGAGYTIIVGNRIHSSSSNLLSAISIGHPWCIVSDNILGEDNLTDGLYNVGIDVQSKDHVIVSGNIILSYHSAIDHTAGKDAIKNFGSNNVITNNIINWSINDGISTSVAALNSVINGNFICTYNNGITLTGYTCIVSNNFINAAWTGHGIYANNCSYVNITGNYLYNNSAHSICISSGTQNAINNNYIFGVEDSGGKGISLDNETNCMISSNYIYGAPLAGVYVINGSTNANIIGNYIMGNLGYIADNAIYIANSDQCNIQSNYLNSFGYEAIEIVTCGYSKICNNYIYNTGVGGGSTSGISFDSSSGFFVINDNFIFNSRKNAIKYTGVYPFIMSNNMVYNHGTTAFNIPYATGFVANGNVNYFPGAGTNIHGMDISSSGGGGILTGNRCFAGLGIGGKGFNLPGGVVNTMTGNISKGGDNPRSWSSSYDEDIDNTYIS